MSKRPRNGAIEASSAGVVIIGNEILSGRVQDENLGYICRQLNERGVPVRQAVVIPDDIGTIARAVRSFSEAYDVVITTGGVGPTHDDVTMAGVAGAFRLSIVRHAELEAGIRTWYGNRTNDAALKMADLPEGAELIQRPGIRFPPVRVGNVFILPGIPQYLRDKFEAVVDLLKGKPRFGEVLRLSVGETEIADLLEQVERAVQTVSIGSYPQVNDPECKVVLTLESPSQGDVEDAVEMLRTRLPEGSLLP